MDDAVSMLSLWDQEKLQYLRHAANMRHLAFCFVRVLRFSATGGNALLTFIEYEGIKRYQCIQREGKEISE